MDAVLIIGLLISAGLYIATPFFKKDKVQLAFGTDGNGLADLESEKENLFAAIHDLDFDYRMGKLSYEDFEKLNQDYKQQTVDLLRQIDLVKGRHGDGIENKIRRFKKQHRDVIFCSACGEQNARTARFCSQCGAAIGADS